MSILLFFFQLLFSSYFCSGNPGVVFIVSIFLMSSSYLCINASTLSLMLATPIHPYILDTYSLSTLSLGCKALYIVMSFLVHLVKFLLRPLQ